MSDPNEIAQLTPEELQELGGGERACYARAQEALKQIAHTCGTKSMVAGFALQLRDSLSLYFRAQIMQGRVQVLEKRV
jgi:hypothetical protein